MSPAATTHTRTERKEAPMPSRLHRRPSGPRARLLSLLALSAAFLLVPAGQAAAEHGGPHLTVNVVGEEGGGGEVASPGISPYPGTPPIACMLEEGAEEPTGVCENEMDEVEEGVWAVSLKRVLVPLAFNSELLEWKTGGGAFPIIGCNPGEIECLVSSPGGDGEVTATFTCVEEKECPGVPLTLTKTGTGKGTVKSSPEPDGIACGAECTEETRGFVAGSTVTLTATPKEGTSVFLGWHGADAEAAGCDPTGATPTCEVVMSAAKEVEAQFDELIPHTLTVEATGEGSVSAAAQPEPQSGEISGCEEAGGECAAEYGEGQTPEFRSSQARVGPAIPHPERG